MPARRDGVFDIGEALFELAGFLAAFYQRQCLREPQAVNRRNLAKTREPIKMSDLDADLADAGKATDGRGGLSIWRSRCEAAWPSAHRHRLGAHRHRLARPAFPRFSPRYVQLRARHVVLPYTTR
jgi:hypothetical protein